MKYIYKHKLIKPWKINQYYEPGVGYIMERYLPKRIKEIINF
jgi:hypothetical protein